MSQMTVLAEGESEFKERPRYRLLKPFYAPGDVFIPTEQPDGAPTEILYDGIPNPEMEPLNAAARANTKKWLDRLPTPIRGLDSAIAEAYTSGALRRPAPAGVEVIGQDGRPVRPEKRVMGAVHEQTTEIVSRPA